MAAANLFHIVAMLYLMGVVVEVGDINLIVLVVDACISVGAIMLIRHHSVTVEESGCLTRDANLWIREVIGAPMPVEIHHVDVPIVLIATSRGL